MQSPQDISIHPTPVSPAPGAANSVASTGAALGDYRIIRRNGAVVAFEPSKIAIAMTKAFLAVNGGQGAASARIRELVEQLTDGVVAALVRRHPGGGTFHIEDVQDQVELSLMRSGEHDVARAYVLYRAKHMEERRLQKEAQGASAQVTAPQLNVLDNGVRRLLDMQEVRDLINAACAGLEKHVDADAILAETVKNLYDGVPVEELHKSAILAARALMEKDPAYSQVTARILLHTVRKEVFGKEVPQAAAAAEYLTYFPQYIAKGIAAELLNPVLASFDLERLAKALVADRDLQFGYIGLQTLYDRYFLHIQDVRIEMPQAFYMRVAMGLALNEADREARAIEFYSLLSSFDFMSSTPTLFNSGTLRSQLSSCYLSTVSDDLEGIYDAIKDNALLAKFAGGLGNDWTPVRALGAHIKG
ncbi:MAG: ATP cone domain-containing protein, partial [Janthinobacterium sp.]